MTWQVAVFLQTFFAAFHLLLSRKVATMPRVAKHLNIVNAGDNTVMFLCGLLIAPFFGGVSTQDFTRNIALFVGVAGAFTVGSAFLYKSMTYLESGTSALLQTLSTIFTIVFAVLLLGENLSPVQLVGFCLILPSVTYVLLLAKDESSSTKSLKTRNTGFTKGVTYSLIGSLCIGIGAVAQKYLLDRVSIGSFITFAWLLQSLIAIAIILPAHKNIRPFLARKSIKSSVLSLGLLRASGILLFLVAQRLSDSVSIIAVLSNFRIIIIAVLAAWLLKERRHFYRKLAAGCITVLGLSIIFAS